MSFEVKAQEKKSLSYKNYFEDKEVEIGEKIICATDESIGFNWKNNKFVQSRYKTETYKFEKIDHRKRNRKNRDDLECEFNLGEKEDELYDNFFRLNRCYKVKESFSETPYVMGCVEFGINKLKKIDCGNGEYVFHPEQLFFASSNNQSKSPEMFEEYKDSFSIGHGSCTILKY